MSGSQWIRYAIAKDPNLNTYTFNPSAWQTRINAVAAVTDATDPNLLPFFMRGGKLTHKTHSNDFTSSPFSAFLYYESVADTTGPYTVDKSMRLYVVPGANHAGGNVPNTTNVSLLAVLENWV